jgi:hypothetical protein
MAGECVRYRCGGVTSGGPIAAVSKGVATRIGGRLVKWLEGAGASSKHSTYSFTDTYRARARARMPLSVRLFVRGPALRCRCPSRGGAAGVVAANQQSPTSPPRAAVKRAGFPPPPRRTVAGLLRACSPDATMARDSIGVVGAARGLRSRGRGLRTLQDAARVGHPRVRQTEFAREGEMHGPGADVAVTSDGDQEHAEKSCRARHVAAVLMSWHPAN